MTKNMTFDDTAIDINLRAHSDKFTRTSVNTEAHFKQSLFIPVNLYIPMTKSFAKY